MIVGLGVDLVYVPGFRDQLAAPGSRFAEGVFTAGERTAARSRPGGDEARHLATRYAAKEAFLKAWSAARFGRAPAEEAVDLAEIEVRSDAWGRPSLLLHGRVARRLAELVPSARLHLSLSHDGDHAIAVVAIERTEAP